MFIELMGNWLILIKLFVWFWEKKKTRSKDVAKTVLFQQKYEATKFPCVKKIKLNFLKLLKRKANLSWKLIFEIFQTLFLIKTILNSEIIHMIKAKKINLREKKFNEFNIEKKISDGIKIENNYWKFSSMKFQIKRELFTIKCDRCLLFS